MRRLVVVLAAALWLVPAIAVAQEAPVLVRSDVDRSAIAIGDQILLTVTVDMAPGYRLTQFDVPRAIGDFEVVESLTVLETRAQGGATRTQLRFLVTAFGLGEKRIPVIGVAYRAPDGAEGQARTARGHVIAVQSVVQPGEDTSDIKPLKPPIPVPVSAADLARVVPLAIAVALILVAAVLVLRSRRRPPVIVDGPAFGPARVTLDELQRVLDLGLPEQGRTREHYELVSTALRAFISRRYGLAADARTARELRRELEHAGVGASAAQLLCEALADAEAVRYEERSVSPAQSKRSLRDLIDLMRRSVAAEEYELIGSQATA